MQSTAVGNSCLSTCSVKTARDLTPKRNRAGSPESPPRNARHSLDDVKDPGDKAQTGSTWHQISLK